MSDQDKYRALSPEEIGAYEVQRWRDMSQDEIMAWRQRAAEKMRHSNARGHGQEAPLICVEERDPFPWALAAVTAVIGLVLGFLLGGLLSR